MKKVLVSLVIAVAGLTGGAGLTACSSQSAAETVAAAQAAGITRVGPQAFAEVLARPGVEIIDVRTPEEFAEGHIDGAVNIPVQSADFTERISQLDPAVTYAVYCRSGNRSRPAVAAMRDAGITEIVELESGTKGWISQGQALVR